MLPPEVIRQLSAITLNADALALVMLEQPQAPCPVTHHFGPGIYIRSVSIKAGDFLIGHAHTDDHTVMVLKGRAVVLGDTPKEIDATSGPVIFTGGRGAKIVAALSDCEWANIFQNPDNEKDIDSLENRYLVKSDVAKSFEESHFVAMAESHNSDRYDYLKALSDIGMTEEQAKELSEREEMADMPPEYLWRVSVRESPIHGKGLFLSCGADYGEPIAPASVNGTRTMAGKYVNHSASPNCTYKRINGETWLVASKDIEGAMGGFYGDELTVDYRQSVKLSMEVLQ